MWTNIKSLIRKIVPQKAADFLAYKPGDENASKTYSQEGEDILLYRIFYHEKPGFYVDIGAHHPFRFSNTKILYDFGWHGINIEPNPDVAGLFSKWRPRDINLSMGVSPEKSQIEYFRFDQPALNSFSEEVKNRLLPRLKDTMLIETLPLSDILKKNLEPGQMIDFMNVDAEGMDMEILQSNDWEKYRPRSIMVEVQFSIIEDLIESEMHLFLTEKGYSCYSKLSRSAFYVDLKNSPFKIN